MTLRLERAKISQNSGNPERFVYIFENGKMLDCSGQKRSDPTPPTYMHAWWTSIVASETANVTA